MAKYRTDIGYRPVSVEQIQRIVEATGIPLCEDAEVLASDLDEAFEEFIHTHYEQSFLTRPKDLADTLNVIAGRSDKLLKKLGKRYREKINAQLASIGEQPESPVGELKVLIHQLTEFRKIGKPKAADNARDLLLNLGVIGGDIDSVPLELSTILCDGLGHPQTFSERLEAIRETALRGVERVRAMKATGKDRHKGDVALNDLLRRLGQIYTQSFKCKPTVLNDWVGKNHFLAFVLEARGALLKNLDGTEALRSDPEIKDLLESITPERLRDRLREIGVLRKDEPIEVPAEWLVGDGPDISEILRFLSEN